MRWSFSRLFIILVIGFVVIFVETLVLRGDGDTSETRVICTITTKSYIGRVRTLADSLRSENPEIELYVLVVDDEEGYLDPNNELFTIIYLKSLGFPSAQLADMLFRYTAIELCTAVKPAFMRYLLLLQFEKVIYMDPDIFIMSPLSELWAIIDAHSIVLTPHIVDPLPEDGLRPSEVHLLQSGTMNLGFIAINARYKEVTGFLDWWHSRLLKGSFVDIEKGYHFDQKWVEFAVSFYEHVYVLRDQAYNVAYWNLHERGGLVSYSPRGYYIIHTATAHTKKDTRIVFFHFSGLEEEDMVKISRHQNRFNLTQFPNLQPIFRSYIKLYQDNCYPEAMRSWPYTYDFLADGTRIPLFLRKLYSTVPAKDLERIGDPFRSFLAYAQEPAFPDTKIPRFLHQIWLLRADLRRTFPNPLSSTRDADNLMEWYWAEYEKGNYEIKLYT